jgi:hypothetical protein
MASRSSPRRLARTMAVAAALGVLAGVLFTTSAAVAEPGTSGAAAPDYQQYRPAPVYPTSADVPNPVECVAEAAAVLKAENEFRTAAANLDTTLKLHPNYPNEGRYADKFAVADAQLKLARAKDDLVRAQYAEAKCRVKDKDSCLYKALLYNQVVSQIEAQNAIAGWINQLLRSYPYESFYFRDPLGPPIRPQDALDSVLTIQQIDSLKAERDAAVTFSRFLQSLRATLERDLDQKGCTNYRPSPAGARVEAPAPDQDVIV